MLVEPVAISKKISREIDLPTGAPPAVDVSN
jgi:hypothetical protein